MNSTKLLVYATLALSLLSMSKAIAAPDVVAETSDNSAPPLKQKVEALSGVVRGSVKAMLGSSFGYITPREGQQFELDLSELEQKRVALNFDKRGGDHSYIPIPGPFSIVDIEEFVVDGKPYWSSFKAISKNEKSPHNVRLEVEKKPGRGNPNFVEVWILIENNDRIWGVCQIEGLLTPPQPKND